MKLIYLIKKITIKPRLKIGERVKPGGCLWEEQPGQTGELIESPQLKACEEYSRMATVALFRISCKKAKDRKRTSVMTQMKYCKQEMLVIETTGVLMEVKTVKPWMYSAGRDISISNGVNVRCEKKFVLCFGGFFFFFLGWTSGRMELLPTEMWNTKAGLGGDSQKCSISWDVY